MSERPKKSTNFEIEMAEAGLRAGGNRTETWADGDLESAIVFQKEPPWLRWVFCRQNLEMQITA